MYNNIMKTNYRRTRTTVSMLNYHFVFCPKYRRKVFNIEGFEDRFKQLAVETCKRNGIRILAMECHIDHVHLFVSADPILSPADIMRIIKTNTSRVLLKEFSNIIKTNSLWTRSYFVSTAGNVSSEIIQQYVESQKTKG